MKLFRFVGAILLYMSFSVHAQALDIRPYVDWIHKNTRFSASKDTPLEMYPAFGFFPADEYERVFGSDSVAHYNIPMNKVFINQNYLDADESVIIHELVHFFQFVQGPRYLCREQFELEAYEIQLDYLRTLKSVRNKKAFLNMRDQASTMIRVYRRGAHCSRFSSAPVDTGINGR